GPHNARAALPLAARWAFTAASMSGADADDAAAPEGDATGGGAAHAPRATVAATAIRAATDRARVIGVLPGCWCCCWCCCCSGDAIDRGARQVVGAFRGGLEPERGRVREVGRN